VGLDAHEQSRDALSGQFFRAKKMAAPKSGQVQGGNAQEGRRPRDGNRDTALQQYAEVLIGVQDTRYNDSRQNAAETLGKTVIIA
jgi:hypothetical protein